MYLNFFSLGKEPFQITPDPSFLYLSPSHKEALASIMYGVEKRKGFILIVGAVGVGKTTILRAYLERSEEVKLRTIYVFNANITYNQLLKYIFRELDIVPQSLESSDMVNELHQLLVEEYKSGRNVLLLIDEAQNMPIDTLENLRMLSNLETATEKLLQIVFSAQPEFERTLNLEELKQLKQRVAVKAVISPLAPEEGLLYIRHRLKRAAAKEQHIFTTAALKEIVRLAKGIPRLINVLCDNSLITAFGYGKKKVDLRVVKEIASDFGLPPGCLRRWPVAISLSVFVCGIGYFYAESILLPQPSSSMPAEVLKVPQHMHLATHEEAPKVVSADSKETAYVHRVIEKGDTLAKMIIDVYGHVDQKMIRLVKKTNPIISDENLIIEGGEITFPIRKKD